MSGSDYDSDTESTAEYYSMDESDSDSEESKVESILDRMYEHISQGFKYLINLKNLQGSESKQRVDNEKPSSSTHHQTNENRVSRPPSPDAVTSADDDETPETPAKAPRVPVQVLYAHGTATGGEYLVLFDDNLSDWVDYEEVLKQYPELGFAYMHQRLEF